MSLIFCDENISAKQQLFVADKTSLHSLEPQDDNQFKSDNIEILKFFKARDRRVEKDCDYFSKIVRHDHVMKSEKSFMKQS